MMTVNTIQQAIRAAQAQLKGLEGVPEKYRPANHVARVANLSGQVDALRKVLQFEPSYVPDDQTEDLTACECCGDIKSDVQECTNPMHEDWDAPAARVMWCEACFRNACYAAAD